MTRFLLDTGIASDYINRRHGVYERAQIEVAKGNPIGIGVPVLAELVFGIERSQSRDCNLQRLQAALPSLKLWRSSGRSTRRPPSNMAESMPNLSASAAPCRLWT